MKKVIDEYVVEVESWVECQLPMRLFLRDHFQTISNTLLLLLVDILESNRHVGPPIHYMSGLYIIIHIKILTVCF